jgi:hypothetical protein
MLVSCIRTEVNPGWALWSSAQGSQAVSPRSPKICDVSGTQVLWAR